MVEQIIFSVPKDIISVKSHRKMNEHCGLLGFIPLIRGDNLMADLFLKAQNYDIESSAAENLIKEDPGGKKKGK